MAAAGYSGTPLVRKLGIREGSRIVLVGAPDAYSNWVEPLPDGVVFGTRIAASADMVHVFATGREVLAQVLVRCRGTLRPDAAVWVSWPKKAAKLATEVDEAVVRELALPLGFVDIKVCAVTEIWSGLKLVVRKELR